MKELYNAPELEIITFDTEDVITTSLSNAGGAKDITSGVDITIN